MDETNWYCPLLDEVIEDGHCTDINLQRLGYFKPDVFLEAQVKTSKTVAEISMICEVCPNSAKVLHQQRTPQEAAVVYCLSLRGVTAASIFTSTVAVRLSTRSLSRCRSWQENRMRNRCLVKPTISCLNSGMLRWMFLS